MVASVAEGDSNYGPGARVSIPFIAGQWSLPMPAASAGRLSTGGLNPLHCGAVVASEGNSPWLAIGLLVSIPFIAGQWSLPTPTATNTPEPGGLNPLHCGAVVASV